MPNHAIASYVSLGLITPVFTQFEEVKPYSNPTTPFILLTKYEYLRYSDCAFDTTEELQ